MTSVQRGICDPRKGHLRSYNDVANLNIPRIMVMTWSVKILLYVIRIVLTRGTNWCQLEVCILFRSKVLSKFVLNWHSATVCTGGRPDRSLSFKDSSFKWRFQQWLAVFLDTLYCLATTPSGAADSGVRRGSRPSCQNLEGAKPYIYPSTWHILQAG